jgi:hypothetical protein
MVTIRTTHFKIITLIFPAYCMYKRKIATTNKDPLAQQH